jgi:hypothetical protein
MTRYLLGIVLLLAAPQAHTQTARPTPAQTRLLDEVQRRAFRFFWEKADPATGLVNDRAKNNGPDDYTVASIASTGFALASLPVAVERNWIGRPEAQRRAEQTLTYLLKMPHQHGWLTHFVDRSTGQRVWNSEVSTIDTALLVLGAITAGQYFKGEVARLADNLYDRLDWRWVRTNGGTKPEKRTLSMGWRPETGFITSEWGDYNEGWLLYLLGLGAEKGSLDPESWSAWKRQGYTYQGREALSGGPLFLHQMPHCFYNVRDMRDRLGYDYWVDAVNSAHINKAYCLSLAGKRKAYASDVWGLTASDGPKGYNAYGVPEPEDGTVGSTAALTSLPFTPEIALAALQEIDRRHHDKLWGRYGFGNAFNVDADWYDPDVIGIDLGMALLAIENYRTGLPWKLVHSHPATKRALEKAGFQKTKEGGERPLRDAGRASRPPGRPSPP